MNVHKSVSITVLLLVIAASSNISIAATTEMPSDGLVPISSVLSARKEYDGSKITLVGIVSKVKFTHSLKGKPYTLFKLADADSNHVKVYIKGHHEIEKGDEVMVYGKFKRSKKYLFKKFKNVLKGKQLEVLG